MLKTSSTQDIAKRLSPNSAVISTLQTEGRGRVGKKWHSEEGGLYLSLNIPKPENSQELLSLTIGLAVAKLLESFGLNPGIKWVNDIYYQDKKLAGILIENLKNSSIIGIGMNVNQRSFPEGLNASSLYLIFKKEFSLKEVALELFKNIFLCLKELSESPEEVIKEVSKRLLYVGSVATSKNLTGTFIGISQNGSALLKSGGKIFEITSGELKF
ncbi:MAG: biotin--[acetyl-CoA-carboxylase] ligase [Aquificaceae bacterium]